MIAASPWGLSLLLVMQAACWLAACRAHDDRTKAGAWQLAAGWLLVTTISVILDP